MRLSLPLTLVLFAVAGAVSYLGTRGNEFGTLTQPRSPVDGPIQPRSAVASITLPFEEPALPPGPHQQAFQVSCTTCHSTRLVLTQPPFPKGKWEATVKKMVDAYGAPLSPDDQARAVEYLMAIRGNP